MLIENGIKNVELLLEMQDSELKELGIPIAVARLMLKKAAKLAEK